MMKTTRISLLCSALILLLVSCTENKSKTKIADEVVEELPQSSKKYNVGTFEHQNYTFMTKYDKTSSSTRVEITNAGNKLEPITLEGKLINTIFGDFNRDKKDEVVFLLAVNGKQKFTSLVIQDDYASEIYLAPSEDEEKLNSKYRIRGSQLEEYYQIKSPENKTLDKLRSYNMVKGEAGFLFKPEGWTTSKLDRMQGQYASRDSGGGGYYKVMLIKRNDFGEWVVNIKVKENETKALFCEFEGVGEFKDKDLFVPLNSKRAEYKGILQIRFLDINAIVTTANTANIKEMATMCNGGGSIAGMFQKTDI